MSTEPIHERGVVVALEGISAELSQLRDVVEIGEAKTTEQFISDIVSNLQRREHLLKLSLQKVLTQNDDYLMPNNWIENVLRHIEFLQNDSTTRAKVEMVAEQQARHFWGVLQDIQILIKSDQPKIKVSKVEPGEDHMKN